MAPNIDSLNKADLYKIVANNKGLSSSQAAKNRNISQKTVQSMTRLNRKVQAVILNLLMI